MRRWSGNQKKPSHNFDKLLYERLNKTNLCRLLTAEQSKRLAKSEAIAALLKRWKNAQSGGWAPYLLRTYYVVVVSAW